MAKKNENDIPDAPIRKPVAKKEFSLDDFKKENKLDAIVKFKPRKWLPITNVLGGNAFCKATGLPGLPANDMMNIIGHTDSGKSTLLYEIAYSCQHSADKVLPVFIIAELKFAWEHLKTMGIEYEEIVDENTGEIEYKGDFLFFDRSKFNTIEEMGEKINRLFDLQRDGKLQRDLCFLIDSVGTIQSNLSYTSNNQNNEWDAGAISRVFGKGIIPKLNICKKDNYPYNNYMAIVCQVWVRKPEVPRGKPKIAAKGGDTLPFNSTIQVVFGNVTNSGISKLKARKNGVEVTYATRTKVNIAKNHITGISLNTRLIATPHGFIADSEGDIIAKKYFKEHANMFMEILGGGNIDDVEYTEENNEEEYNTFDLIEEKD
jgi:hypothetical protein